MGDQKRLRLILAQARIAKAALSEISGTNTKADTMKMDQANLAIDAVELLADPNFHTARAAE